MKNLRYFLLPILFFITLFPIVQCTRFEAEKVLFDAEADSELDHFHWECHVLLSLSELNATHGTKSLKVEMFPSQYPGLTLIPPVNDWHRYTYFLLDIYNTQKKTVPVTIRIDDRKNYPDYSDRYNGRYVLKPGSNAIRIPLNILETQDRKRKLDLRTIYRVIIFSSQPENRLELYVDYMRLVKQLAM